MMSIKQRGRRKGYMLSAALLATTVLGGGGFLLSSAAADTTPTAPLSAPTTMAQAGFADLVAKVKPAVVNIATEGKKVGANEQDQSPQGMPQIPGMPGQDDQQDSRPRHAQGSGFIIDPAGYVVTNNHVIDGADKITVTMDNGSTYKAKLVGRDPKTDVALLKIESDKPLPFVAFGDSGNARVGDWVIAVGNPFGLGGTVTAGIVSASGRDIGNGPYDDFIQIDAPINKGNSGGPAFDMNGNVIGVNTAIFSPSGGSVGIGFDIPASTAKLVVAQLKDKGGVTRGWLGVQVQPVTSDIADSLGLKEARGAIVDNPQDGSPAAKAGIEAGDVITAVNGTAIKDSRDLARTIATLAPGSSVKLDVFHKGESKTVTLALGELPNERQAQGKADDGKAQQGAGTPRLGLSLAPAGDVQGAGQKGVVVTEVDPQGPAAQRGIQTGDVILNVGGKPVANVGDVRSELAQAKSSGKNSVLLQVKSAEATRFVAVPLA